MCDKEMHNPHDKGYKTLLSSKKAFVDLLRGFIKEDWVGQIREEHLIKIDKSYILQDFSEKEADIVYQGKLWDREVIFFVLLELQSTVDNQMPYRLLLYMTEIWREYLKNEASKKKTRQDFRLPAIIPMVLYNGVGPWTPPLEFKKYQSGYEYFGDRLLNFRYELFDVNRYKEEDLLDLSNLIGAIFFLDQHISEGDMLKRLRELVNSFRDMDSNDLNILRNWVINILTRNMEDDEKREIRELIQGSEEVEEMVYNLERLYYESKEKGIQKGREEGILKGKEEKALEIAQKLLLISMPLTDIAKATGLTEEKIEELKKSLNKQESE